MPILPSHRPFRNRNGNRGFKLEEVKFENKSAFGSVGFFFFYSCVFRGNRQWLRWLKLQIGILPAGISHLIQRGHTLKIPKPKPNARNRSTLTPIVLSFCEKRKMQRLCFDKMNDFFSIFYLFYFFIFNTITSWYCARNQHKLHKFYKFLFWKSVEYAQSMHILLVAGDSFFGCCDF